MLTPSPMNYFDLFELPIQFAVDAVELKKKYLSLSRKFHPDFFTHEEQEVKELALENSSSLNKAWQIFQDPLLTLQYALNQLGIIQENDNPTLPAAFLQEMMEINELLMTEDPAEIEECKKQIKKLEDKLSAEVENILAKNKAVDASNPELEKIRDYYYKRKYLDRIQKRIEQISH